MPNITIQPYTPDRATEIADLFHRAVHAIDPAIYSPAQQEAWAPTPPDYARWATRLAQTRPFLALLGTQLAGFIELEADGHIDCLYTLPERQGQGVASTLYRHVLTQANARQLDHLYVEASRVARPFFAHRGFVLIQQNTPVRDGIRLVNFTMELPLNPRD